MRRSPSACVWMVVCAVVLVLSCAGTAVAQGVNSATLSGIVTDPQGRAVRGANVTVTSVGTGAQRTAVTDEDGRYKFLGLAPGEYDISVEAGAAFATYKAASIVLTVGQEANYDPHLLLKGMEQTVTVTTETAAIETSKTEISQTVEQRRIENLPINGRNYINFTLTTSQVARDATPSIGAAPTSGLNFSGQRARSNQVSVDGADAVDNSVNGIRATVSQEAVQEFQLIISNYNAEYGRATGGVVNIVTKSGGNEMHGNVFGFLRHKSIQARNPFSVGLDPATGNLVPVKQPYTRVQAGATLGGPLVKDKTFYFLSYETTRRQETGFTSIGANNFGVDPLTGLTPAQTAYVNNAAVPLPLRDAYRNFVGASASVALNGRNGPMTSFPTSGFPLPASFVGLNQIRGNYPVSEGTSLWSARLDHRWNSSNNSFVRASVSPSLVTGVQVNAQNQNFGQNAGSRTSLQQTRDLALVGQHITTFSNSLFNEARFQYARRGLHYGYSQLPGGGQVAVNIIGVGFFGREPFSTEDRIERRFQWTDNVSWIRGKHTFKFGGDVNLIQLRSKKTQIFELNFGGIFDVGPLPAASLMGPNFTTAPGLTAVQVYGAGIPGRFIQGIGNSSRPFDNKAFAGFVQDSWRFNRKLTLNYGLRYDIELTPTFTPDPFLNAAAEAALNVVEGIPRSTNNWSPRFGLAWDPRGDGKTVVRAGYGIFFDHPPLATAFLSATTEGVQSSQLIVGPGSPGPGVLNASSIFQGVLGNPPLPGGFSYGYLSAEQRFDSKLPNSIFTNQNAFRSGVPLLALPFTLPAARNFVFGYAQQGNLTIEHELGHGYKLGVSYTYTHGLHLNRPRNINQAITSLEIQNADRAVRAGLIPPGTTTAAVAVPGGMTGSCVNTPLGGSVLIAASQILGTGFGAPNCGGAPIGFIGTSAVFNFFRPSGPNPTFAALLPGGYGSPTIPGSLLFLANLAGFPTGFAGVRVPYADVVQQESSGNSVYHGLTLNVSKRFTSRFEFLSSYTWSHAIDDSTDLSSLLSPQDSRRPFLERANSAFDQRHRWVTSAVMQSHHKRPGASFGRNFLADFTVAPIVEVSSGRPFTVLAGKDFADSFSPNGQRPSVAASGGVQSPFLSGVRFVLPNDCGAAATGTIVTNVTGFGIGCFGNLGRNPFTKPGFFQADLRVSRKFYFTEKANVELIADTFNLFNRNNISDVSPLCDPTPGGSCTAGQPTASYDARQFQFALKISW